MADRGDPPADSESAGRIAILVENHRAFLRYLTRRTGSREAAEDILQDAFVRSLARVGALPEEAVVPWFYRVLRHAVIDRARRRAASNRALDAFAREMETAETAPAALQREICACVARLAATLKPEYAEALQAIDIDGMAVKTFANRTGLTASNAGVRVFRARQALKKQVTASCGTCAEHGCVDCSCGARAG